MRVYPTFFRLAFSWMDAERAHKIGFKAIRLVHSCGAGRVLQKFTAPAASLQTQAFGLTFPSPFGLAAGFDKEGHGIEALTELGFGHVEVGTITGQAQPGNPAPRLFRLVEDRAVINRMGFNNDGAAAVAPRLKSARAALQRRHPGVRPVIGVNIGKSKVVELEDAVADYLISARSLAPAADYLVVNVSSPNTPGLRLLQDVETLRPLLAAVGEAADQASGRHVPLLVKIAPDLSDEDIDDVARLALDLNLDGIIATNTTIARTGLSSGAGQGGGVRRRRAVRGAAEAAVAGGAGPAEGGHRRQAGPGLRRRRRNRAGRPAAARRRRHPRAGIHGVPLRRTVLGRPHQPAAREAPVPALSRARTAPAGPPGDDEAPGSPDCRGLRVDRANQAGYSPRLTRGLGRRRRRYCSERMEPYQTVPRSTSPNFCCQALPELPGEDKDVHEDGQEHHPEPAEDVDHLFAGGRDEE